MMIRQSLVSRRRATAAVELALLLPTILVPMLFGMWEVGRLVQIQQIVDNAAREGGRQAASGKYTNSQVQTDVQNYLTNSGLSLTDSSGNSDVTVTVTVTNLVSQPSPLPNPGNPANDATNASQQDIVNVSVKYPYSNIRWLATNWFVPANANLTCSVNWRCVADLPVTVSTSIPTTP
jgi:Flp pilus assembly protein TadG